ncbi:RagB/SusD family nutrient uptake outer membrane protein [Bacteroidaceae bacterium HV4-6-C5C]|nr:RagB/SusD family nutrient uptake outer membrane protein [Bacteroidaceae bacterium HV4-6-C5C]
MNKKIILLFILAVACLTGCDLDRYPDATLADSNFWHSEADLRGACNRLYNQLSGFSHDTRADELVKTSADAISSGQRTVPSTSSDWSDAYARISTANNIIQKTVNPAVAENIKNRYLGEAYFFRAYYYFMLVKKYGDVPLILQVFDDPKDPLLKSPRTPREEIIQQCYSDLDFAAAWLPKMSALPAADWGRVTRSAALALTERIGLYEGTYSKYHNLSSDYRAHLKRAIDAAELVMKEGHSLYPDFQKLFYFDGEGPTNKENIFVKVYGPNGAGTVTHGNSRGLENSVTLSRSIVDMFLYSDGLPREKSPLKLMTEVSYNDVFKNRDPRMAMTLYQLQEDAYKGPYMPFNNASGNGYSLKKGFMLSEWATNSKETVDKMLIRYAEVLISYTEALYEYNGSITDAQLDATVNAIRARAGFTAKLTNVFVNTNGLNMLNEIRRERTIEFIDENMRYDDIIRWKIAENVLPANIIGAKFVDTETTRQRSDIANRLTDANGNYNGLHVSEQADMYVIEVAGDRKFDPNKDYLYPVPLSEISLSGGAVTQNPGWE